MATGSSSELVKEFEKPEDSSCYEDKKLRDSLQSSQVDNMLTYLSNKPDLRVVNQQRDEPDLTASQKLEILTTVLESSPLSFLKRFGRHLDKIHLDCFDSLEGVRPEQKSELKLLISSLRTSILGVSKETRAKNRRYEALNRLVDNSGYFTEEEMQRRDPILYDQLIGRYHTKEERAAFLKLLESAQAKETSTPLSDMLIAHMDRLDGEVSQRRMDQEDQLDREQAARDADEEDDSEDDEYMDASAADEPSAKGMMMEEFEGEEIDDDEKDLLKEEFFTTMYTRFLEGKDTDFDYATVDNNEEYDCGENMMQDAEDKYFDADDDSSGSDLRSQGSKNDTKMIVENPEESEEDELDAYMKNIEAELKKQKR